MKKNEASRGETRQQLSPLKEEIRKEALFNIFGRGSIADLSVFPEVGHLSIHHERALSDCLRRKRPDAKQSKKLQTRSCQGL